VSSSTPLDQAKLQAEIDKINAEKDKAQAEKVKVEKEVEDLKLSFWKRYQWWSAVTPAALAIGALLFAIFGNFFSAQNNQLGADRKNYEYDNKLLLDKKDALSRKNDSLAKTADSLQKATDSIKHVARIAIDGLERYRDKMKADSAQLSLLKTAIAEKNSALGNLNNGISNLKADTTKLNNIISDLKDIKGFLVGPKVNWDGVPESIRLHETQRLVRDMTEQVLIADAKKRRYADTVNIYRKKLIANHIKP
jgi:uncharacterized phage infection (PIP) family protein YhgE